VLYNDVVAQEFNDDNVTDPKLSSFITNNRERTPAKLKTVPEKYGYINNLERPSVYTSKIDERFRHCFGTRLTSLYSRSELRNE